MGAWTLLDAHTLLASPDCSSPFPAGRITFAEDKEGPPSRAYLKLWEALTRCRKWPGPGERCLDAGASPGGWTWALARLGAGVIAVDRSPLEPRIAALPGVRFIKHDAFTLKPEDLGALDWLFCDAACYPLRLYEWVERWLASGLCANFVCTIKMQGVIGGAAEPDFDTPRRFASIPGSAVVQLWHNRHELTWIRRGEGDTLYYHDMIAAVLAKPGLETVLPLAPEFIRNEDGAEIREEQPTLRVNFFLNLLVFQMHGALWLLDEGYQKARGSIRRLDEFFAGLRLLFSRYLLQTREEFIGFVAMDDEPDG
jgi:23S rRNA (cytidine2498-2'-O)-methyltransferase